VTLMATSKEKEHEKTEGTAATKSSEVPRPQALTLSLISVSAALYTVAITVTSFIPTPWGVGQFRPGVVIPAFFTIVFGPLVGGVGAAIGTFIGDFALYFFGLTNPLLSLMAGVPANFVGFYLFGWLTSKRYTWSSFILNIFAALVVGNLIAALGILAYFWFIDTSWALLPVNLKMAITIGLALFWLGTMIIFVVPLVPVLVMCIEPSLAKIGVKGVPKMLWGKPSDMVKSSGIIALILAGLYVLVIFAPGGSLIFAGVLPPELLLLSSAIVLACGLIFVYFTKKLEKTLSK